MEQQRPADGAAWEDLRIQARKLDSQLYTKLSQYCKHVGRQSDPVPSGPEQEQQLQAQQKEVKQLEAEIELILTKVRGMGDGCQG